MSAPISPQQCPAESVLARKDPQWDRDRQILQSQLHNVLLALRTNVKFSSRMRFVAATQGEDHVLTLTVKNLRQRLYSPLCERTTFTDVELLQPFCAVALSEETTGPITGVALSAFISFLEHSCSFITPQSIVNISHCATSAKSEVTDTQSHEAVLARILQVLVCCVKHEASSGLSEAQIVTMLRGCLAIAVHGDPSELLRRTAEQAMHDMITCLFTRVHAASTVGCFPAVMGYISQLSMCMSIEDLKNLLPRDAQTGAAVAPMVVDAELTVLPQTRFLGLSLAYTALLILKEAVLEPRNVELLMCVRDKLCRAILMVGRQSNEHVVIMSQLLRTLHLVVSFCSAHVVPQLLSFIVSIHLYPACATMADTLSKPVDPHQGSDDVQERYEMIMESLLEFCSEPAFPAFVYETYDLNYHAPNVFESLCNFLAEAFVQPAVSTIQSQQSGTMPTVSQIHVVALDCILAMLLTIATRCSGDRLPPPHELTDEIAKRQAQKEELLRFARAFKEHPRKSMRVLQECKHLDIPVMCSGWDVGEFLYRHRDVLDKEALGEFVAELGTDPSLAEDADEDTKRKYDQELENTHLVPGRTRFHAQVLKGYVNCHQFAGKTLLRGMRELLCGFRIPGEAQKIDRTMEEFAAQWLSHNRNAPPEVNPFADADACFIFSFSCMILNTDLHSAQVKEKMSTDAFKRMLKGTNGGGDVPEEYMLKTYADIRDNEIRLRDTVYNAFEDDFIWSAEVARSAQQRARMTIRSTDSALLGAQDSVVFSVLWRPALKALSFVLDMLGAATNTSPTSREAYLMQNVLDGFHLCATIAQSFQRADVVDQIVVTLAKYTHALNLRGAFRSVVEFGHNVRGMQCLKCVYSIVRTCGNSLQDSWKDVVELTIKLYLLGLLPEQREHHPEAPQPMSTLHRDNAAEETMLEMYTGVRSVVFRHNPGLISHEMRSGTVQHQDPSGGGWLSSIFGSGAEAQERSRRDRFDKEIVYFRKVESLVADCDVLSMMDVQSTNLGDEALTHLVRGITRAGWYEKTSTTLRLDAHSMSFCLHSITSVLLSNVRRESLLMPYVKEYCTTILNSASTAIEAVKAQPPSHSQKNTTYYWMTVGENTCLCLLRLWYNSLPTYHEDFLTLLDQLKPQSLETFASTYICGLFYCCVKQAPAAMMSISASRWEVIIRLIHKAAILTTNSKARICAFTSLTHIAGVGNFEWPGAVPAVVDALSQTYLLCVQDGLKNIEARRAAAGENNAVADEDWDVVAPPIIAPVGPPVATCDDIATPCIEVERVRLDSIVDILFTFHERLVRQVGDVSSPDPAWVRAWFCVLRGLGTIVFTMDGAVWGRKGGDAMLALQRALLDTALHNLPPQVCLEVVRDIVIPLVEKLCQNQATSTQQGHGQGQAQQQNAAVASTSSGTGGYFSFTGIVSSLFSVAHDSDTFNIAPKYATAAGQEEVQARSLSLLTKVFLHDVLQLAKNKEAFVPLWSKILAMLYAFHTRPPNASQERLVCDAVHEGVKNLVFVLSSLVVSDKNPYLTPYPQFWTTTKQLVLPFDFSASLMPHLDAMETMEPLPAAPAGS
eukprot:PhM_4_TR15733/c0_g1_i1/m.32226/K18443/GBF1; golgi-specific brefeldin A-resistance guanine nucleotide exchange factor 1